MRERLGELVGLILVFLAILAWWWLTIAFTILELDPFEWTRVERIGLVVVTIGHFIWWSWEQMKNNDRQ